MNPLRARKPKEKTIELQIRSKLESEGWFTAKTHGSAYQPGWPDLYCYHRIHGVRWIEVKRPGGRFTKAQRKTFPEWLMAGVEIWVLDDTNTSILSLPGNAAESLARNGRKR